MFRNYFFINIILVLLVSFLGLRFYKAITYKKDNPVNITVKKAEPGNIEAVGKDRGIDKASLRVITEKDVFRSSRKSSLSGADGSSAMPSQKPPTLFGTIIVGAEKRALLKEDAGKATKTYRLNESVSGYLIVDILDDRVLLEAGGQTIEVKLRGKKSTNPPQLNPRTPVRRPQAGATRRRVRPNPQRPSSNESNFLTSAPVPVPPPVPAPAPEPLELKGDEESSDDGMLLQ